VSERPIRIVHGTTDALGAVASCRAHIERLRTAGKDVQLTGYPAVTIGDAPSAHPEAVEAVKAILTTTFKPHPTGLGMTAAPRADRSQ
jgi:predicted esterase